MPKLLGLIGWEKEEIGKALIVVGIVLLLVFVLGGCLKTLDNSPIALDKEEGVIQVDSAQFYINVININYNRSLPYLEVLVNVTPTGIFTEEFPPPPIWLLVLSKDGHYFGEAGPLNWTLEELLVDESERDYHILQADRQRKVKSIVFRGIPRTDKDVVNMYSEVGGFSYPVLGAFNRHFDFIVVGKEQYIKFRQKRGLETD